MKSRAALNSMTDFIQESGGFLHGQQSVANTDYFLGSGCMNWTVKFHDSIKFCVRS